MGSDDHSLPELPQMLTADTPALRYTAAAQAGGPIDEP